MLMTTIAEFQKIDEHKVTESLEQAAQLLDSALQELALDFSSVCRIDAGGLRTLEELAHKAEQKKVKVILRGVNVDLYKAFKLIKLANRLSFVN
jgi:ABC-type transporter Mla MlaB component